MRGQLERAHVKPQRFNATVFAHCNSQKTFVKCLEQQGYGDCVNGGIDWEAVRQHDGRLNEPLEVAEHVIANWCSHKQLFSKLAADNNTSEFIMIFEDDVFINYTRMKPEIERFVQAYQGWDLVVVDPFNDRWQPWLGDCDDFEVGRLNGTAVWNVTQREIFGAPFGCRKSNCSVCGAQAWLVRQSALDRIVSRMDSIPNVPLNWLPRNLPGSLAWKPTVANNLIGMDF